MLLKRLFSRCKERITYILILSLFWLIVLIMNNPFESDKGYAQSIQKMGEESIGATSVLQKGNAVSQTFIASDDRLESVNVLVAAYQRTNNAKVKVTVQDSANNIIYCETQDTSAWSDNTYFTFHFARQNNSRGKKYTILFEGIDGDESNSPALWYTNATASLKNTIENGEEKNYALMVTATYWKPVLATGYIVCWAVLILLSYIFMLFLRTADEKTFLAFSILLGSLFVVLNPFFHVLDEGTHFLKSFSISRFDWLNDVSNGKIGSYVPENYSKVIQFESTDIKSLFDTNLSQTYFSENQVFYENPYVASVIPINHAIAAVGILFGRLLHMSVLGIIWAGRLANYIYYTVLCYFAIKNAKYYKSIFFVIATLPLAQWLAASYSTDPVLLASALLFVSICLKYKFSDQDTCISKKDMVLLLITGICIASVKYYIYTPMLLVFFLIPRKCFAKKQRSIMVCIAAAALVGLGIIQIYLLKRYPYVEDRNGHVSIAEQIIFMKDHFLFAVKNYCDYFVTSINYHITNFFYNSTIPSISALLSVITVLSCILIPDKYVYRNKREKRNMLILFTFIAISIYLLIMTALYAGFTPVGSYGIQGLQSRYLLPILFFIMASLASAFNVENHSQKYTQNLAFFAELNILLCLVGNMTIAWTA